MLTISKFKTPLNRTPIDTHLLLHNSLERTSQCFSLDHCFHPEKDIQKATIGEDCPLKRKLTQIGCYKQEEQLESYYDNGANEMLELTEYYKYYTQTSITYLPSIYKVMHSHREQRKALEYNRLKHMLDLSSSTTHNNSSQEQRVENSLVSSFRLLSMLKITQTNQESVLLQKLKDKLQLDYGPNRYQTLEELDSQYCFPKMINLNSSLQNIKARRPSKKSTKVSVNKQSPFIKKKNLNIRSNSRNNSCGNFYQHSSRKQNIKIRFPRKKHGSMDNLNDLVVKEPKPVAKEQKQVEIKRKIMGMKEQIKKQKQKMMRKTADSARGKKVGTGTGTSTGFTRKIRN